MNRVFKVVFNRERGKSMVVNEVTRSHQVGKKTAITVAVVGALMAGNAFAETFVSDNFVSDKTVSSSPITATNVEVTSKDSNALNFTSEDSVIDVKAEENISLDAKKNGIQLQTESDNASSIVAGGTLNINAGGVGIHTTVHDTSTVVPGAGLLVKANKIEINAGATILNSSESVMNVEAKESINLKANERLAISAGKSSELNLNSQNIKIDLQSTTGEERIAVNGLGKVVIKATDSLNISASSANASKKNTLMAIYAEGDGNVIADSKIINISAITDNEARAVKANNGGKVVLGSDTTNTTNIVAKGKSGVTVGIQVAQNNSNITTLGNNLFIDVDGGSGYSYAVMASSNNIDGSSTSLDLNADNIVINATAESKGHSNGIVAFSEGHVNVAGNLTIKADNVIATRGNSLVVINEDGEKDVKLDGNITFNYDKDTSGSSIDSTVKLNLSKAGSYLNGNIQKTAAPENKDTVTNMQLKLSNGGTWTNTEDSFVNELTLDKGGVINVNLNDKGEAHDVTVNTLKGENGTVNVEVSKSLDHGAIVLDKSYARPDGDHGAESTTKQLAVNLTGVTADNVSEEQFKKIAGEVIEKAEGTAAEVSHKTTLAEGDYNGAMSVVTSKDGKVGSVQTTEASSLMQDSLVLASASTLSLNRILMNDVRKRLGDIRVAGDMDGAWARYDGGKLSGDSGLENKFHTIQFGYDMALSNGPRVGMAASYTKGDSEYKRGDADMDAYSLAAYSVWTADNGMFADVIARVAKAENDMTVDGSRKGSLDSMAYSVSGEFGWRFDLTDMVYVEPQVEATYTYIDSDSMKLGSSSFDFDNVDSLMGRAGFAAGFKCPDDKGDVYVRVSAVHEFLGDAAITGGNGKVFEIDGKDTWVEYGIGANFNVNKNTYVYADLERTSGATLDEDWRANVGVRYNF